MSRCTYCFGKGSYSLLAVHESMGDFEGERVRSKSKHIANPPCRHCKGTGECSVKDCKCQGIIAFAEQYRGFIFNKGNVYNSDVVEKIRLAQALLIAVEALEEVTTMSIHKEEEQRKRNIFRDWRDIASSALGRIRKWPIVI